MATDVPVELDPDRLADVLLEETRFDAAAVEVGRQADGTRWTVTLAERPFAESPEDGLALGSDSVYLVTGAAGSIVSAVAARSQVPVWAKLSANTDRIVDYTYNVLYDYGFSEIEDLKPLVDALNKSLADMMVTSEYVGRPRRWATGIELTDRSGRHTSHRRGRS